MNSVGPTFYDVAGQSLPQYDDDQGIAAICDCVEGFFEDAKNGLMRDLVDFNNRDDFNSYMKSMERNYYQKANIPNPPYEVLPEFPPKPFQAPLKKKERREQENKDFIDKVLEANRKRQQQFQPPPTIDPLVLQREQYFQSLQQQTISQLQTPFLDQTLSRNPGHRSNQSQYSNSQQHSQFIDSAHHTVVPPYLQKFVAGPTHLEANPLSEPRRSFRHHSPSKLAPLALNDYDLKNPDVQYERYKQMMQSQFYNPHANSNYQGFNITGAHTFYQPPPPFNYYQKSMMPVDQAQMINQGAPAPKQPPGFPQHQLFPQTQQIYHQPNTNAISLYQQPNLNANRMDYPTISPMVYRNIKLQSGVDEQVIQSIGGITDTVKPLQETLNQHELRPFHIQRDYKQDYIDLQRGRDPKRSYTSAKPESMKLVSVSPFRAVVRPNFVDQEGNESHQCLQQDSDDEEEEEFERQQQFASHNDTRARSSNSHGRQSPIKDDSQYLRGQRDQYLNHISNRQPSANSSVERPRSKDEQFKIKSQSEHLRAQREQFLNSFQRPSSLLA